jgi:7-cyano-7-deazaguanine synthase
LFRSANALTGDVPIPSAAYADLEGVSPTYVPFRNGNLISAAASVAVQMNCSAVVTANHANDWANWAYPDCSPEFIGAMANALWVGTYQQVRLVSPFLHRTKGEIAAVGAVLNVPYELTRSCYTEAELHCGTCPTCRERHEAFAEALYPDPTVYAHQPNGPGCQVSGAPLA